MINVPLSCSHCPRNFHHEQEHFLGLDGVYQRDTLEDLHEGTIVHEKYYLRIRQVNVKLFVIRLLDQVHYEDEIRTNEISKMLV